MIAVLFEAWPGRGHSARYFEIAAALRPELDAIDGFLGIERYESLAEPGKLLSLSWWRDEAAIAAWRTADLHRAAQAEGRSAIFRDYRLRIASVVRDYSKHDRAQAPGPLAM
jgi:heme-degrading monooxygenase HmoA